MKTSELKKLKNLVRDLQALVHSNNVYGNAGDNNGRRFICPQIVDGAVYLKDLYTGKLHRYAADLFRDGYGKAISL